MFVFNVFGMEQEETVCFVAFSVIREEKLKVIEDGQLGLSGH
jgi:hypothetical protein